jgi:hypothetical protein
VIAAGRRGESAPIVFSMLRHFHDPTDRYLHPTRNSVGLPLENGALEAEGSFKPVSQHGQCGELPFRMASSLARQLR